MVWFSLSPCGKLHPWVQQTVLPVRSYLLLRVCACVRIEDNAFCLSVFRPWNRFILANAFSLHHWAIALVCVCAREEETVIQWLWVTVGLHCVCVSGFSVEQCSKSLHVPLWTCSLMNGLLALSSTVKPVRHSTGCSKLRSFSFWTFFRERPERLFQNCIILNYLYTALSGLCLNFCGSFY